MCRRINRSYSYLALRALNETMKQGMYHFSFGGVRERLLNKSLTNNRMSIKAAFRYRLQLIQYKTTRYYFRFTSEMYTIFCLSALSNPPCGAALPLKVVSFGFSQDDVPDPFKIS